MRRRIREIIVAFFILGGIAAAVFGYFWFSGRVQNANRQTATVHFAGVAGLRDGDPAQVLGIEKGRVRHVVLEGNRVRVVVALDPDVVLTEDTRFAIRSMSYLGSDRYLLVMPGTGPRAAPGAVFEGRNEALDLEETFLRLDSMLYTLDPSQLTAQLKTLKDELAGLLRSEAGGLSGNIERVASSLENIERRVDSLVAPGSTVGRLAGSAELYDELRQTNAELKALVADIKANPERYVKVRFSLFGRK
jgi:phospholipid/cholesterol/gamma-HCH transport system substrate-binding protein